MRGASTVEAGAAFAFAALDARRGALAGLDAGALAGAAVWALAAATGNAALAGTLPPIRRLRQ